MIMVAKAPTVPAPSRTPARLAEGIVILAACAAPWMFGSVDAWAELILEVAAGTAAVLAALFGGRGVRWKSLGGLPSLGLGGLVILGLVQASPMPARVFRFLDPNAAALRAELLPSTPERVIGDPGPIVALPRATISQEPGATLDTAARLTAAWLLFQAVVGLGGGYGALRRFGWAVAVNAALLSLFALVQSLTWNGNIFWVYPAQSSSGWSTGGPFVVHTHLAEYMNMGLGFSLAVLLGGGRAGQPRGRSDRVWAAYVAGVLATGVITAQSRGGFLAMLATAGLTGILLRVRLAGFGLALFGAIAVVAVFLGTLGDAVPYGQRLQTILNPADSGYEIRLEVWRDAARAWRGHPILGTGLGSFGSSLIPYSRRERNTYFAHAEDEYVEMLAEGGILGTALSLVFLTGIYRAGRRAASAAPSPADRALVVGASAGVAAVLVQCVSDFGLHLPGVSVAWVVLCAHLSHLGDGDEAPPEPGRASRTVGAFVFLALAALVVHRGVAAARAESWVAFANLAPPGSELPTPTLAGWPREELERAESAMERAVGLRPDWAEGHIRLGLVRLALYRSSASEWLAGDVKDRAEVARLSDPLWLLAVAAESPRAPSALLEQEPVRSHLVPAARSFLLARECSPVNALVQAELGALAYLLEPPQSASVYASRALRVAGSNGEALMYSATVANLSGDSATAARGWRQALRADVPRWQEIADEAGSVLSDAQILAQVIPEDRGRYLLYFADYLYTTPADQLARETFLRKAADRAPLDLGLAPAERLAVEAQARAGFGDRAGARAAMAAALAAEPDRYDWRERLVHWMLAWGEPEDAHDQALIGVHLSQGRAGARALLDLTSEALARGAGSANHLSPDSPR